MITIRRPVTNGETMIETSGVTLGMYKRALGTNLSTMRLRKQIKDLYRTLADCQHQVSETRSELEQLRGAYTANSNVLQFPYGYGNMLLGYGMVPQNTQTNGPDRISY